MNQIRNCYHTSEIASITLIFMNQIRNCYHKSEIASITLIFMNQIRNCYHKSEIASIYMNINILIRNCIPKTAILVYPFKDLFFKSSMRVCKNVYSKNITSYRFSVYPNIRRHMTIQDNAAMKADVYRLKCENI